MQTHTYSYFDQMNSDLRLPTDVKVTISTPDGNLIVKSNNIVSVKQHAQADPLTRSLPQYTADITFVDFNGRFMFGTPQTLFPRLFRYTPVSINYTQHMSENDPERIEYSYFNYFYLREPPTHDKVTTTWHCGCIFDILGDYRFYKWPNRLDTYQAYVDYVITDAIDQSGLQMRYGDTLLYDNHYVGVDARSHSECLQGVTNAAGYMLYLNREGDIQIRDSRNFRNTDYTLKAKNILKDGVNRVKTPKLQSAKTFYYSYFPAAATDITTLYSSDGLETTSLHIEYPYTAGLPQVSGRAANFIIRSDFYTIGADISFTTDAKGLDFKVKSAGHNPGSAFATYTYADDGDAETIDNPYVDKLDTAERLGKAHRDYYAHDTSYEIEYRGEPALDCGDIINVEYGGETFPALIIESDLEHNGALHGRLVVKRWN